jgi:hypothetical protein
MPEGSYPSPEALREGIDRYNHTLMECCAQLDVRCIDLATSLNNREDLFYDDCHFNEAGCREVARLVAEGLARGAGPAARPGSANGSQGGRPFPKRYTGTRGGPGEPADFVGLGSRESPGGGAFRAHSEPPAGNTLPDRKVNMKEIGV